MNEVEIRAICEQGLILARDTLIDLGSRGRAKDDAQVGKVIGRGDFVTKGDNAVSKALVAYFSEKMPGFSIQSEEGDMLYTAPDAKGIIRFDEIDGTANYEVERPPYCTVICVSPIEGRLFKDIIYGGVLEHVTGKMWSALKGRGCFFVDGRGKGRILKDREKGFIEGRTDIFCDNGHYKDEKDKVRFIDGFERSERNVGCAGYHLAAVANGEIHGFVGPVQKGHELGAGYRITRETGGGIVDFNGRVIGHKPYEFNGVYQIVAGQTLELAFGIRRRIANVEEMRDRLRREKLK